MLAAADLRPRDSEGQPEIRDLQDFFETMNTIIAIHPYKHEGLWVFDDDKVGLVQEPFVAGADTIIDRMVEAIPDAASGFTLVFSANPFPGHQAVFEWRREETGGNWYYSRDLDAAGW